jgi:hypothetical protein
MKLPSNLQAISDKTRLLRDRLLISRFDYQHPTLAVVGVTLQKGVVVAVGYGRRKRRLVRFDKAAGHMSSQGALYFEDGEETGEIVPVEFKVGDVVEFSPRNQFDIPLNTFWEPNLIIIKAGACYGIDPTESRSAALLWQQSAGYDRKGNFLSGAEDWMKDAAGKS